MMITGGCFSNGVAESALGCGDEARARRKCCAPKGCQVGSLVSCVLQKQPEMNRSNFTRYTHKHINPPTGETLPAPANRVKLSQSGNNQHTEDARASA